MANSDKDIKITPNTGSANLPKIEFTGQDDATKTLSVANSGALSFDGDLTVSNLTVSGSTTTVNTETLTIDDNIVVLNNNASGTPSENAGIEVERGNSTNTVLRWNETTDRWQFTNDGSTYYNIPLSTEYDNSTDVTLATVSSNYLSLSGQAITAGTVPLSLGGTGATSASAARTALNVDAAGTDNSTNVTLANTNYLSISGQAITGGTVPIGSGGTGSTTAPMVGVITAANADAARTVLSVDASGTDNSTDVTLASVTSNYLTLSGQAITAGTVPIILGGTGATTASAARTGLGATTFGAEVFTLADTDAVRFLRMDADNGVSALTDAQFRSAIGAGTSSSDTVDMGDGFIVVGDSNSNATTIIEGETLTIAGGTGITTDTTADGTLTITGSGEANQNAWGIITVPAGTTTQTAAVDADSIAFTAAGGMTITGGTDTIAFSSADTNYYATGLGLSSGTLTATVSGASNPTVDLSGLYTAGTNLSRSGTTLNVDTALTGLTDLDLTEADHTIFETVGNNTLTIGHSDTAITIAGNLTVSGNATTVNTTTLSVEDPLVYLANGQSGTPSVDIGLIGERGSSANVGFIWDESADQWAAITTTDTGTTAGNVSISSYANLRVGTITGNITGTVTGDVTGDLTGTADTVQDDAITDAKLAASGLSASRLTIGTLPDAQYDSGISSIADAGITEELSEQIEKAMDEEDIWIVLTSTQEAKFGHLFGQILKIDNEEVRLIKKASTEASTPTNNAGDDVNHGLKVTRAARGTTAAAHTVNTALKAKAHRTIRITKTDASSTAEDSYIPEFGGADSSIGSTAGLVPIAETGDAAKYLRGDGTWQTLSGAGSTGTVTQIVAGTGLSGGTITTTGTIAVSGAQTGITTDYNTARVIGRDAHNNIDFTTDNEIHFKTNNETPVIKMKASGEVEATSLDISGDVDVDGTLETDNLTIGGAQGSDGDVLTSTGSGVAWEAASSGGASAIGSLDDVLMDATNWVDGFLLQTDSDGSAPTTGTLSSATGNIGIGKDVFKAITSGDYNIMMGYEANETGVLTGHRNIGLGFQSFRNATSGEDNIGIGTETLDGVLTGFYNVAIGRSALGSATGADSNIAIGKSALAANTTGDYNIAIGYEALDGADTESNNLAIGRGALGGAIDGAEKNIAIGNFSLDAALTGDFNTAVGYGTGTLMTSGQRNSLFGYDNGKAITTGISNTILGYECGIGVTEGNYNVMIGNNAGTNVTTGDGKIVIGNDDGMTGATTGRELAIANFDGTGRTKWIHGTSAGAITFNDAFTFPAADGSANQYLKTDGSGTLTWATLSSGGASALDDLSDVLMDDTNFTDSILIQTNSDGSAPTTGTLDGATNNIGIGKDVFKALTSGDNNIGFGLTALEALTGGSNNIALGDQALSDITTESNQIAIGQGALRYHTTGSENIAIGYLAIGASATNNIKRNIAIGAQSMHGLTEGDENTAVGRYSLREISTGSDNTALGASAGQNITTGERNTLIGMKAGDGFDTESDNIAIGYDALGGSVAGGAKNVAIGNYAGDNKTSGSNDVLVGYDAGSGLTTGHSNTFIGTYSAKDSEAVSYNVAVGYSASQNNQQGGRVTSIGSFAGQGGDGSYTVYVGYGAGQYSTGGSNTFIGDNAGWYVSGDKNIAIGTSAQTPNLSGDGCVIIGYDVDAPNNSDDRQLIIAGNDGSTTSTWITGDSNGNVSLNQLADVVLASGSSTVLTQAQSGSYVYWTAGDLALPTDAAVGTQFTIFNNTGSSGTVAVGDVSDGIVANWATNAAVADNDATSYVCVATINNASHWVQVGA